MFLNKFRLRKSQEIAKVFRTGKYIHGRYIFIKYIPNDIHSPRIAISISTKLFKLAVHRNRLKRLLREAFQPHLKELPTIDILVISKKSLKSNTTLREIQSDVSNIINKLHY